MVVAGVIVSDATRSCMMMMSPVPPVTSVELSWMPALLSDSLPILNPLATVPVSEIAPVVEIVPPGK